MDGGSTCQSAIILCDIMLNLRRDGQLRCVFEIVVVCNKSIPNDYYMISLSESLCDDNLQYC